MPKIPMMEYWDGLETEPHPQASQLHLVSMSILGGDLGGHRSERRAVAAVVPPQTARPFIEMVLMVSADHGPAVSGAHNTIVAARAGKDLVSSLCSGLLTIGPRFGGALDDAASMFMDAVGCRPGRQLVRARRTS